MSGILCSFTEHIQNHDVHINWTFIKRALIELARGLEYMHSKKIGHFDMKSPNIMLDSLAPDSAKPIVKIADFGTSRKIKVRMNDLELRFSECILTSRL